MLSEESGGSSWGKARGWRPSWIHTFSPPQGCWLWPSTGTGKAEGHPYQITAPVQQQKQKANCVGGSLQRPVWDPPEMFNHWTTFSGSWCLQLSSSSSLYWLGHVSLLVIFFSLHSCRGELSYSCIFLVDYLTCHFNCSPSQTVGELLQWPLFCHYCMSYPIHPTNKAHVNFQAMSIKLQGLWCPS